MLITKRTYKKKKIRHWRRWYLRFHRELLFARMFSSNAAKQLASETLQAGKTTAKDIGMKAIAVGETVTIDAGKKLVEKAAKRLSTPK